MNTPILNVNSVTSRRVGETQSIIDAVQMYLVKFGMEADAAHQLSQTIVDSIDLTGCGTITDGKRIAIKAAVTALNKVSHDSQRGSSVPRPCVLPMRKAEPYRVANPLQLSAATAAPRPALADAR